LCVLVGFAGSTKKIGPWWAFVISFIFSPLVGIIIVLLSPPKKEDLF